MATQSTAVAIFEPQNVQTIVQMGPDAYHRNTASNNACIQAGQALLVRVQSEGMSDALDQEIAKFIEKAKITLKNMNGRRSPVTKLFDQLRTVYTTLENEVDPAKAGTVPNQLQAVRNTYAAKKREEAERQRQAEMARQAAQQARVRYRQEVEDDYKMQFNALVNGKCNQLTDLDRAVTLENYADTLAKVRAFSDDLPQDWAQNVVSGVRVPVGMDVEESRRVQASVLAELLPQFTEQYPFEVGGTRDEIADRLPSKKMELERIAKASAEEAAKIKAEMEAREAAEAARKEAERIEREKQEKAAAELAAQKSEMDGLFGAVVPNSAAYQPKTQVKKRAVVDTPDAIMAIVAYWWSQEGQYLSMEELTKTFKKQITFAEKAANDKANPVLITNVRYEDEVKAK